MSWMRVFTIRFVAIRMSDFMLYPRLRGARKSTLPVRALVTFLTSKNDKKLVAVRAYAVK